MSTVSVPQPSSTPPNESGGGGLSFLNAKQLWRSTAPSQVRDAWKRQDHDAAWAAWSKQLRKQKLPTPSGKGPSPLAWGLPTEVAERFTKWLSGSIGPKANSDQAARLWLGNAADREPTLEFILEAVAWAAHLPSLAATLDAETWWALADSLCRIANESATSAAPDPADTEATVVAQLVAGELPLRLSQACPEVRPLYELGADARQALSHGIERLTDGEGLLCGELWAAEELPAASLLLACWTRCRGLTRDGKPPWTADAQTQYEWLVRQALRLSDRRGRLAFTTDDLAGAKELLLEAIALGADASDHAAAGLRLKGFKADDSFEPPAPSNHSDWSELGVLAAGWRDKAPRIVVVHPSESMRVEIHAGKQVLLGGDWPVEASIDGVAVEAADVWECQCWYTDEDGDYLELALPLEGGARLERWFFLSREDGVGFVAEALFSEKSTDAPLRVTTRLPLGADVGLRPERETREALLTIGGKPVAGVIPLALAEWRDDPNGGELTAEDRCLVLQHDRRGQNLSSPLWIDFSASRFEKQRTWRQLAVAEALEKVSQDVAVAYRVQAAKEQWFFYRSLAKPGNRTALGQNMSSECLVGRFKASDGTVDEYFEIEADDA